MSDYFESDIQKVPLILNHQNTNFYITVISSCITPIIWSEGSRYCQISKMQTVLKMIKKMVL